MTTTAPARAPQDDVIREYLRAITDPTSPYGRGRLAALHELLDAERDVLERILLRARIDAVETDFLELEGRFIKTAARWTRAERLAPEVFHPEPIPTAVLRAAGLLRGRRRNDFPPVRQAAPEEPELDPEPEPPAPAPDPDAPPPDIPHGGLADAVLAQAGGEPFTLPDMAAALGRSRRTVDQVVRKLVGEGRLEHAGQAKPDGRRGRSPRMYRAT